MSETLCTIMNRANVNLRWMGGSNVRNVCLAHDQYDVWWPQAGNADRHRVLDIASTNPLYGPYIVALGVAAKLLAGVGGQIMLSATTIAMNALALKGSSEKSSAAM